MPQPHGALAALPQGFVTLLFTDIEGSTALWERDGARMSQALAAHDALARAAVEARHGRVVKMLGDGMQAVFDNPLDALAATVDLQQALADPAATGGVPLRVRCGLHAGVVERRDDDYFGSPVNRAARLMSAAHGGQVLLSQAVVDCVRDALPAGMSLQDLGKVRLKDLATPEHVYQVVHPRLRLQFPALRSLEATPNNLPQQPTSFIGREQALTELQRLLVSTRLLTLTGPGGCGKTRLGLQLAADSLERYPDGAWLVELAPLADPERVPQAVASVLGLKEEPDRPISQTLSGHLKDKRALLILDNCEHLLESSAQLVDILVRQCPHLTILASSREALAISGERVYRVPSLSFRAANDPVTPESLLPLESVRLFVERTQLHAPQFTVSHANALAVASICERLDGIPLAIELAAARVRSLSVHELNQRLDQRFRLLTGGSRTALPRQQTLRSTIDWSYDLLKETEQVLLCRLTVFSGGCTLEAAERVCSGDGIDELAVLDLLASLCDKSLLQTEERDGAQRYRLLETIRQYARDRLHDSGSGERWRARHLHYFAGLAERADSLLRGPDQHLWLDRLETEHDNLRAALTWSTAPEGDATSGLRLANALLMFWYVRGYFREACRLVTAVLDVSQNAPAALRAEAMGGLGAMMWQLGDYATARRCQEQCLEIHRTLGNERAIGSSLIDLGGVDFAEGNYASARSRFEEALAIRRRMDSESGVAGVLNNLGVVARARGDLVDAARHFEESLHLYRHLDDAWGIALSLCALGGIARERGEFEVARRMLEESLVIRRHLQHRKGIAESLEQLASVTVGMGYAERAAAMLGAAERLREDIDAPMPPSDRPAHDRHVTAIRAVLNDDAAFDHAWGRGRAMPLEQVLDNAMSANPR